MEKFVIDYSETSFFKGIRIPFEDLDNGIAYLIKNEIKDVSFWNGMSNDRRTFDFNFLKDLNFLETFHFTIPLTKKTDISPIKNLENIIDFRWAVDNDFNLDFSNFGNLEKLNTSYNKNIIGWNALNSLKRLQLGNVNSEDLTFIKGINELEYFRIIKGKFTSIKGVENCTNLKTLFFQHCNSLETIFPYIEQLHCLVQLNLEKCKKIKDIEEIRNLNIENISII